MHIHIFFLQYQYILTRGQVITMLKNHLPEDIVLVLRQIFTNNKNQKTNSVQKTYFCI